MTKLTNKLRDRLFNEVELHQTCQGGYAGGCTLAEDLVDIVDKVRAEEQDQEARAGQYVPDEFSTATPAIEDEPKPFNPFRDAPPVEAPARVTLEVSLPGAADTTIIIESYSRENIDYVLQRLFGA